MFKAKKQNKVFTDNNTNKSGCFYTRRRRK